VDTRPARVRCNTCGGEHGYRPPVEAKPKAARTPTAKKAATPRAAKDPREAERQMWENLRPEMDRAAAKDYTMTGSYKVKDMVDHPIFGLGVVLQVSGNKVDILFKDGKKMLRCR
jgi:hypothetical protein